MRRKVAIIAIIASFLTPACARGHERAYQSGQTDIPSSPREQAIRAAMEQTEYTHRYDPSYIRIDYPGGDVPLDRGVCSDVIVRAFRKVGVDLQKEVHEDMTLNFSAYSKKWGAKRPDSNIDHRRVQNLMTYFDRKGKSLPITDKRADYLPGDVVAWDLGGGLLHIGMVSNARSWLVGNYEIVHNIGAGARLEDVLFSWKIIGHYRYFDTSV
jgi:uncharacterized protein YijF (DUF1287 family)